jgi:RNA polymerase sigma-70 factor (ECF subfamily)
MSTPRDFEDFYRRSKDPILRAVALSLGSKQLAEEAVAEAFTRAFARWSQVSCHPRPEAWVARTAINANHSWWRKFRREVHEESFEVSVDGQTDSAESELVRLLAGLPHRQRQVVGLRLLLGLTTEETAETLSIATGTVTAHLHRALTDLRKKLTDEEAYP